MKISPSIASADQCFLADEIARLGDCYENLHIDVEDGNFISNITFGFKTICDIRKITTKPFSVHLMVSNPGSYIEKLKGLNCSHIFVHVERQLYLLELINQIKSLGCKAGLALNAISSVQDYEYCMEAVDALLFMTAEPDLKNQQFNQKVLEKIGGYGKELWADGGIKECHLSMLQERGIEYVVMGREIFSKENPKEFLLKLDVSALQSI